jgi:hypothetical protein
MDKSKKIRKKKANAKEVSADKKVQEKKEGELLVKILIVLGVVLALFFVGYFFAESQKTFESEGVKFNIVQEGELIFYQTKVPVYSENGEKTINYFFYLRTDPRELEKMDFEGQIEPTKLLALNYSDDMGCQGYGIIALTNIINLYQLMGGKVTIDRNATCDEQGRYLFLNIQKTNQTGIEKKGPNCYDLNVNNCDVFPSTEKFMLELLAKIKKDNIRLVSSSGE